LENSWHTDVISLKHDKFLSSSPNPPTGTEQDLAAVKLLSGTYYRCAFRMPGTPILKHEATAWTNCNCFILLVTLDI